MIKTRAFLTLAEAEAVAERLSMQMIGWQVSVQPSPDRPEAWGIRADQSFVDINEVTMPTGFVGHSVHVWLRADGTITIPERKHEELDCVAALLPSRS